MSTSRKGTAGNKPRASSRARGDDPTGLEGGVPQTDTSSTPHGRADTELFPDLVPTAKTANRISSDDTDAVLDSFNFGRRELLKAMPELRVFGMPSRHIPARGRARITIKRRRLARELILYLGKVDACRAARNLALSPHHRGENDRKTAYYDLDYVARAPDTMLERCPGDDQAFLRRLKASSKRKGWGRMEKT